MSTAVTIDPADHVLSRCKLDPVTGCLVWQGCCNNHGTPVFGLRSCGSRDARAVLWLASGRPLDARDVFVTPDCADGKRCLEPSHQKRMSRLAMTRRPGNASSGLKHSLAVTKGVRARPTTKLNMETARAMRARYAEIGNALAVAREFGVERTVAHRVVRNQRWKETTPWTI